MTTNLRGLYAIQRFRNKRHVLNKSQDKEKVVTKIIANKKHKSHREVVKQKNAEMKQVHKRCSNNLKLFDLFGQTVNLTWNGEEKFTTNFGAIVTIALIGVLIGFSVFRTIDVFKRLNPVVSRTGFLRSDDEKMIYQPAMEGFDFAFSLTE